MALLLILIAALLWRYFASYESTDDAQVDVHLYPVSARISGYVSKVNVNDNEYVQQGTVLVEIDPKDYEVAIAKARADLANAEATAKALHINVPITSVNTSSQLRSAASDVENAKAGILAAEKQLLATHAQLDQAEANDVRAQDDLKSATNGWSKSRMFPSRSTIRPWLRQSPAPRPLLQPGPMRRQRSKPSCRRKSRLAQAEANHRAAQTGPQQVASTNARALAAVADVQQKRAALEQAELNLQYTKIIAPVSGEVNKTVVVGMNVQPGQQLLTVVPLDEVWVTANFKETQLKQCDGTRAARYRECRFERPDLQGPCGQHRRRDRSALQLASAGKCHRKLREDRAASSGEDRSRAWREPGSPASSRHECSTGRVPAMSEAPAVMRSIEQASGGPSTIPG